LMPHAALVRILSTLCSPRRELRPSLGDRGAHQPHRRAALRSDPHSGVPRLHIGKHRTRASLAAERHKRLSGYPARVDGPGSLLPPVRHRDDAGDHTPPGRALLRWLSPRRHSRERLHQRALAAVGRRPRPLAGAVARARRHRWLLGPRRTGRCLSTLLMWSSTPLVSQSEGFPSTASV
jgi:hypothetical protein